MPVQL
jgi:hypothetical protein